MMPLGLLLESMLVVLYPEYSPDEHHALGTQLTPPKPSVLSTLPYSPCWPGNAGRAEPVPPDTWAPEGHVGLPRGALERPVRTDLGRPPLDRQAPECTAMLGLPSILGLRAHDRQVPGRTAQLGFPITELVTGAFGIWCRGHFGGAGTIRYLALVCAYQVVGIRIV